MGENSKIEWTDHTFNPWIGCTKVSPACDHCYAERVGFRLKVEWGGERRRTSESNWWLPFKWNAKAERDGIRRRVFCASLADVFDNQVPDEWRADLWRLIGDTPHLDWLLLTKRPQNFTRFLPDEWLRNPRPNVWGMTTVERPDYIWRVKALKDAPFVVRGLSMEPLLALFDPFDTTGIHWIIGGGESGGESRPTHPDWALRLKKIATLNAGVAFHWKQWGNWLDRKSVV